MPSSRFFVRYGLFCSSLAALWAPVSSASDGFEWRGFLTAGYTQSFSTPHYLSFIGNDPNFLYDAKIGAAFTAQVTEHLEATSQFVASGTTSSYTPAVDFAYVTYRPTDALMVRAGKMRFPMWLIAEYYNVGYTYPWLRPPPEVYAYDLLSTFFGALIRYEVPVGEGTASLSLYGGSSPFDVPLVADFAAQSTTFNLRGSFDRLIGAVVAVEWLRFQVRASIANAVGHLGLYGTISVPPGTILPGGIVSFPRTSFLIPVDGAYTFWSLGFRWRPVDHVRLKGEYFGSRFSTASTAHNAYVTLGIPWDIFEPLFTLAENGTSDGVGYLRYAVGCNFAVSEGSNLKFEWSGIDVKKGAGPFSSPPGKFVQTLGVTYNLIF